MSVIEIPWLLREEEPISEIAPDLKWTDNFMKEMFQTNKNRIICPYPLLNSVSIFDLQKIDPFHQYGTIVDMNIDRIILELDDEFEYELISLNNKGTLAATNIYALNRSLEDDEYLVKRLNTFLVNTTIQKDTIKRTIVKYL